MKQGPTYGSLAVDVERELVSDLVFGLSLVDGRRQCPFSRWGSHHKLVDWHKVKSNFNPGQDGTREIFAGRKFREFWPYLRNQIPFFDPESVDSRKLIHVKFFEN